MVMILYGEKVGIIRPSENNIEIISLNVLGMDKQWVSISEFPYKS